MLANVFCLLLAAAAPCGLTVENRVDPQGVDVPAPRLSWKGAAEAGETNVVQTAWRILVASSEAKLAADAGDLWDSGKVACGDSRFVRYAGAPLRTSRHCFWKVRTWDGADRPSAWSRTAEWLTGVMPPAGWKAKWIAPAKETQPENALDAARWVTAAPGTNGCVTLVRRFAVENLKPGERADLAFASTVACEIKVNGRPFYRSFTAAPDWRFARFRDLTRELAAGTNEIEVVLKPGATQAFVAAVRFPDGRLLTTDAAWGRDLGGLRETPSGRELIVRRETASPAFEKTFAVTGAVDSAVLQITGLGFYEAELNGRRIGTRVLEPVPTRYDRRALYSTYDVASYLKPGENKLRVVLGHGWYDVRALAVWNFDTAPWRNAPRLIAQLDLSLADGALQTVVSDRTWRQVKSPIGYDSLYEGEVIGAWNPDEPDFESRVLHAVEVPSPTKILQSEPCAPSRVVRTLRPSSVHASGDAWVVTFPENFAGWIRMNVRNQKKGDVLTVRYDERLSADGSPAWDSPADGLHAGAMERAKAAGKEVRRVDCYFGFTGMDGGWIEPNGFQTDRFVSSGAGVEVYEPRFDCKGFQYVVLRGLRTPPAIDDITGCAVQTDFSDIGTFACSDETFNELMRMGVRAYKANFANGVPTDCPQRERNGWTGDASIASELAQYCFENTAGYEKWLRDICDAQLPSGGIPQIVPTGGWGAGGAGPVWDSALACIAWNLWCYRGDRAILGEIYPHLVRHLEWVRTKEKGHLVENWFGDWLAVNEKHVPNKRYTASCYYYLETRILAAIAVVLGRTEEAARWRAVAKATREAINAAFYKGGGVYDNGGQTAQALPLTLGLAPEPERKAVAAKLVEAVARADGHVDVGLIGMKHLFRALSLAGRSDLAYRLLVNPTKPSPVASWMKRGGTTLWEDWNDGASRNHVMFGDYVAWAYQYLAGIRLPESDGSSAAFPNPAQVAFKDVLLAPDPIADLDWVAASVDGPYGVVKSEWRRGADGTVAYSFTVPPNTTATIRLPDCPDRKAGSGTYVFHHAKKDKKEK